MRDVDGVCFQEIDEWRRVLSERGAISSTGNGNDQMRYTIREKHSGEEIAEKRHYSQKRTSFVLLCLVCSVVWSWIMPTKKGLRGERTCVERRESSQVHLTNRI